MSNSPTKDGMNLVAVLSDTLTFAITYYFNTFFIFYQRIINHLSILTIGLIINLTLLYFQYLIQERGVNAMGFWIFMTANNLIIPAIMILFGKIFTEHPPQSINSIYGYRTSRSRKSQDTWDFAHAYCGKLWKRTGRIMLPLSIAIMLLIINKSIETIGIVGAIAETIQCIILIATIFPVERALKKNFDNDGNPRTTNTFSSN